VPDQDCAVARPAPARRSPYSNEHPVEVKCREMRDARQGAQIELLSEVAIDMLEDAMHSR
jgi:hypothetical protein